jgi:hypothetical protein
MSQDPPRPASQPPEQDRLKDFRDKRLTPPPIDWTARLTGRRLPPDIGPLEPEVL